VGVICAMEVPFCTICLQNEGEALRHTGDHAVIKPAKYLLKQAAKAEAAARRVSDEEMSESLLAMGRAYRGQAQILKAQKKRKKKK
jgi:hypothetical protein